MAKNDISVGLRAAFDCCVEENTVVDYCLMCMAFVRSYCIEFLKVRTCM